MVFISLLGFPDSSVGKEFTCNIGDPGSIPGSGRSGGEGIDYPLQYSWSSLVAQLVNCLQCGRPGFNPWVGKIPWRRERLPTPVFLPGEFHGQRSLVGYSLQGHKESDMTEKISLHKLWDSKRWVISKQGISVRARKPAEGSKVDQVIQWNRK